MAMKLNTAKTEIETVMLAAMVELLSTPENPRTPEDFQPLAESISPGIIAALEHIIANAETDPGGEGIK